MPPSFSDLLGTAPPSQFVQKIKLVATTIGLFPLTWRPGGIADIFVSTVAQVLGVATGTSLLLIGSTGLDGLAAVIARMGFLGPASEVTPDPPTPDADGAFNAPLDLLIDSRFDVQRVAATFATGPVILKNTGPTRGPLAIGSYHLVDPASKKTFSNSAPLTITAGTSLSPTKTTGEFEADLSGPVTVVANTLLPATSLVGVTVSTDGGDNLNSLIGSGAQANADFIATAKAKLQALSPKLGPHGAYIYFSTVGYDARVFGALAAPVTRVNVETDPWTGVVDVFIGNASGPSVGGDATKVQQFLARVVAPDGTTVLVLSANAFNIAIFCDVFVPTAKVAVAAADVGNAITNYINTIPIGGSPGAFLGVHRSDIIAAIFEHVTYVESVENLLLNGVAADIPLAESDIAVASPGPSVTPFGT